jgi:beta-lactamase class A
MTRVLGAACWVLRALLLGAMVPGAAAQSTSDELKQKFAHRAEEIATRLDGVMAYTIDKMPDAVALLKKSKESRLRRGLPSGVETADKPGELEGVRVDAGIVIAKNRPYVLCVMTTFLKDETEGEHAIEDLSRAAYEYFSRLGAGALGRRLP